MDIKPITVMTSFPISVPHFIGLSIILRLYETNGNIHLMLYENDEKPEAIMEINFYKIFKMMVNN